VPAATNAACSLLCVLRKQRAWARRLRPVLQIQGGVSYATGLSAATGLIFALMPYRWWRFCRASFAVVAPVLICSFSALF
jgi:hypothetical protein